MTAMAAEKREPVTAPALAHIPTTLVGAIGIWSGHRNQATVTLEIGGVEVTKESEGNGPIDALFRAIALALPHSGTFRSFRVTSDGETTDARGTAVVVLEGKDGGRFVGTGNDQNILLAPGAAYLDALNKLHTARR